MKRCRSNLFTPLHLIEIRVERFRERETHTRVSLTRIDVIYDKYIRDQPKPFEIRSINRSVSSCSNRLEGKKILRCVASEREISFRLMETSAELPVRCLKGVLLSIFLLGVRSYEFPRSTMNQLETNLVLWAICSILLFEVLIIICLCRFCFNRIKPKRFYVKVNGRSGTDEDFKAFFQREEYEYLQGTHSGTSSKYQSTILRPPRADELAMIGTIRANNPPLDYGPGISNLAFSRERDEERTPSVQPPHWIELQPAIIHSAPPPGASDYEINSDDYLSPQSLHSTMLDFHPYQSEENLSNFRFQPLRRPELILPQVQRLDTSTESPGVNYSTIVPKSILKGSTNSTPPLDLHSTQPSRASSKYDESPRPFVRINTEPSNSAGEKRGESRRHMQFANVSQLNEVAWETSRDLQRAHYNSTNETPRSHSFGLVHQQDEHPSAYRQAMASTAVDQHLHISRVFVPWERHLSADPSFDDHLTQQKAFEY